MAPFFFFDFTLDKSAMPPVANIPEQFCQKPAQGTEQNNLCPYPIPKIDNIVKDIEKAAFQVDNFKFVSDLFECGAIAISNAVTLRKRMNGKNGICKLSAAINPLNRKALRRFLQRFTLYSPPSSMITAVSTTTSVRYSCAAISATKSQDSSLRRFIFLNLWQEPLWAKRSFGKRPIRTKS